MKERYLRYKASMSRLVKRAAEAAERAVDNVVDDNVFDVSLFDFYPSLFAS